MGLACFLTGTFLCLRYHQDGMFSETWQRLTFAAAGLQPKTKTSDRAVIFNFWNRLGSRIMSMALRGTLNRKREDGIPRIYAVREILKRGKHDYLGKTVRVFSPQEWELCV